MLNYTSPARFKSASCCNYCNLQIGITASLTIIVCFTDLFISLIYIFSYLMNFIYLQNQTPKGLKIQVCIIIKRPMNLAAVGYCATKLNKRARQQLFGKARTFNCWPPLYVKSFELTTKHTRTANISSACDFFFLNLFYCWPIIRFVHQ